MLGKNFIFIEPPKNATTSIRSILSDFEIKLYSNIEGEMDRHCPAFFIKNIIGDYKWSKLITFTISRNPYDRIISEYKYSKKVSLPWKEGEVQGGRNDPYRRLSKEIHSACSNISDYISLLDECYSKTLEILNSKKEVRNFGNIFGKFCHPKGKPLNNVIIKSQTSVICCPYNSILPKHVVKLENLHEVLPILENIGIDDAKIPHLNKTDKVTHELTSQDRSVINKIFHADFINFDYKKIT